MFPLCIQYVFIDKYLEVVFSGVLIDGQMGGWSSHFIHLMYNTYEYVPFQSFAHF